MKKYANKENYLKNLIFYLSEYRQIFLTCSKEIDEIKKYCSERFNKDSSTDTTYLLKIDNLSAKISYIEKYINVTLDFYKEKENATK